MGQLRNKQASAEDYLRNAALGMLAGAGVGGGGAAYMNHKTNRGINDRNSIVDRMIAGDETLTPEEIESLGRSKTEIGLRSWLKTLDGLKRPNVGTFDWAVSSALAGAGLGGVSGFAITPLINALKSNKTANFNNGNSNMNTQIKLAIAQQYLEKRAFQEKVAQAIVKFQQLPPIIKQALFSDEVMQRLSAGDPSMIKAAAKSSLVMHTNQGQIPLTKIAAACTSVAKGKKKKKEWVETDDPAGYIGKVVMDSVKSGGTLFSLPKNMSKFVNKATGARSIQQAVPKYMQNYYSPNYVAPPKPPVTQGNPGARRTAMQYGRQQ